MKMRFILLSLVCFIQSLSAQSNYPVDSLLFNTYGFRCIGPFRGGRVSGVCGDYQNKQTYYMGATGGGVWKTIDGGNNWQNISDGFFGGSIGSVAVCPTDPLLIYVGTGENTLRGNVSEGNGMWKSTDGGRSWKFSGLPDSRHITKIQFHPKNPDIVYCAATGHLFGPNEERGIFRTSDGGKTWKKILFINNETGCVDIVMDPTRPEVLYASSWQVLRTPYSLISGGAGSGIWKSTDGGDTWTNLSKNKGIPKDTLGNIGLAIAPSNPDILYAMIESKQGGLYRSIDAGKTWTKQSDDAKILQRGWYFNKVFVDPKQENLVYICNVGFHKSPDGGKTIQGVSTGHADHHNVWIDPQDGQRIIIAHDGGAQISINGGQQWSSCYNQPTAQFYRVSTDNHFPYRVLGCQQDNSSVRIASRTNRGSITAQDWGSSAGFESGYLVADPLNDDIVYGGNYGGYMSRLNHRTGENRTTSVYPIAPIGEGAEKLKYRFQWNFPLFFSPNNPKRLYAAGNYLFKSDDEGQSWQRISPDLTRNDKSKQGPSGGPITKDNTSVEYYCTIFTAAESAVEKEVLWVGSDDGLIHISRNGGTDWEDVTPRNIPEWMQWNCIEPDPITPGTCYVAGTRYKLDDEKPYLFKTTNYGKTWTRIVSGIPSTHFTRAVRVDPKNNQHLFCGTEQGLYFSNNAGALWQRLQLNLPTVPITDLCFKNNDLVVATQGRAFWILDDVNTLYAIMEIEATKQFQVLPIANTYRMKSGRNEQAKQDGTNPYPGVSIRYILPEGADTMKVSIAIRNAQGNTLRTYTARAAKPQEACLAEPGMNLFSWNMCMAGVEKGKDMVMWNGQLNEFLVAPGNYDAVIYCGKDSTIQDFQILKDPNYTATVADYQAQFNFLCTLRDAFDSTQSSILSIRSLRQQINLVKEKAGKAYSASLDSLGKQIIQQTQSIEEALVQTKAKSGQDLLNYPIRLNDQLLGIFDAVEQHTAPSAQSKEAYADVRKQLDVQFQKLREIQQGLLRDYNKLIREQGIDFVQMN